MQSTPNLYDTLIKILGQYMSWRDKRHFYTLAWMVLGLISSKTISLTAWASFVNGRARYAQSTVRRFRRWLDNERIEVHQLYGVIIQEALSQWGETVLYLALDTSMLWNEYCLIRLSIIYRGRAVPLIWQVIEHPSSSIGFTTYRALLDKAYWLLPSQAEVVFLADRGFADTTLMDYLTRVLKWTWHIRIKSTFWVYRKGQRRVKVGHIHLKRGQARFWHYVYITQERFGAVHLALAKPSGCRESWFVVSSRPTDVTTLDAYGYRFDIEENFLDDKSNGFQLESSLIRSAQALSRLCFVLAVATLFLVCQGTAVVAAGKRRWVDPHWFRGCSYLKIGWRWVERAMTIGLDLIAHLYLSPLPDPEPPMASKKQARERDKLTFSVQFEVFSPYATSLS